MGRIKVRSPWKREDPRLEDIGKHIPNKSKKPAKPTRKKPAKPKPQKRVEYHAYIASKAWQRKREEAFRHHGRFCCECESQDMLHVHHKTYGRLGRERMADLEVLCVDCHALRHEREHPHRCDSLTSQFREIVG